MRSKLDFKVGGEAGRRNCVTRIWELVYRLVTTSYQHRLTMAVSENKARSLRGELYYAFTPELVTARRRCRVAVDRYNTSGDVTRRKQVELWRE